MENPSNPSSAARWSDGLNEGDVEERKGNHTCPHFLSSIYSLEVGTGPGNLSDILKPNLGVLSHLLLRYSHSCELNEHGEAKLMPT